MSMIATCYEIQRSIFTLILEMTLLPLFNRKIIESLHHHPTSTVEKLLLEVKKKIKIQKLRYIIKLTIQIKEIMKSSLSLYNLEMLTQKEQKTS